MVELKITFLLIPSIFYYSGLQLSWLEHRSDKAGVGSSSLPRPTIKNVLGLQLSWESTSLARRGSQVRTLSAPHFCKKFVVKILLFEIVSFCSFNKNIRAFLLKTVPIKVREHFYWDKQVIRILLFIVNYVIKALIKLIRAYGGCLGI